VAAGEVHGIYVECLWDIKLPLFWVYSINGYIMINGMVME
jgi:hypothetical protein